MLEKLADIARQFYPYALRAAGIVVILMLIARVAPHLPAVGFLPILAIYAIPSTLGALYGVVVNRLFRQYKLADGGKLAYLNKRWGGWLTFYFALSLVSAILFVIQAPKWSVSEWAFVWVAIPAFFALYLVAEHLAKQEFTARFRKVAAMKASFYITGVVLCLVYAAFSVHASLEGASTLQEILWAQPRPFEGSPVVLLSELDWMSSYADSLTNFAIMKLEGAVIVAFIVRFVIYAGVFFGLVNFFCFSLLDRSELESEFKLLPAKKGPSERSSYMTRYVLTLIGVFVLVIAICGWLEYKTEELAATDGYSHAKAWVEENADLVAGVVDDSVAKLENPTEAVEDAINAYYDECVQNIDSYMDWKQGFFGGFAGFTQSIGDLGVNMARDAFMEKVADPVGLNWVQRAYAKYLGVDEVVLDLWTMLEDPDNVSWYLLGRDTDGSRESIEGRVEELIEASRAETLASLGIG